MRLYHPDHTTPEGGKTVFVFGSNLAGRHGLGAAQAARMKFGAVYGIGRGRTGMAYAIPTKGARLEVLPLDQIEQSIQEFVQYAKGNPDTAFFVTRIGCALAGYHNSQIAPMFADAPLNCSMPLEWQPFLSRQQPQT